MYRYLWSNGPKEGLEFADYSFEEHFKKAIASYPPREVLWDYIKGRIEKSGLRKYIQFNTVVRQVVYHNKTKKFSVTVHHLPTDTNTTTQYDYVVVASGHYSYPNYPSFPGFEKFQGRVLHAHDFREALEFKNQDILLIGTSYSAEDIGSQCYKYGAKSITVSHRTKPMPFKGFPENWEQVPLLTHVDGTTAYFKNGTSKKVDAIILCTGYKHHFPFLFDDLRLKTDNRLWPMKLYKGIFWEDNPKLIYLGMQDQYYTFNMFDAQAWYARDVILGKIKLPSKKKQIQYNQKWRAREETLQGYEQQIIFQGDYVKDLISSTDYPKFNIDKVNQEFIRWEEFKREDIMTFRNKSHQSALTGTISPIHHTMWIDALDDSMESYLAEKE